MTVNRTWLICGGLLAAATTVYSSLLLADLVTVEEAEEAVSFTDLGDIGRIRISGNAAEVRITGTDSDEVEGRLTVRSDVFSPEHSEAVDGDTLELHSHCAYVGTMFCKVTYDLTVPAGTELVIDAGGGRVTVTDIDAPVDLHSSGGTIQVTRVDGDVRAESSGGSVEITDVSGRLDLDSSGGRIHLVEARAAELTIRSDGGDVSGVLAGEPSSIDAETDGGDLNLTLPDGEDGYALDTSTDGGSESIEIRTDPTSARLIVVSTDGGDLTMGYTSRAG